MADKVLEQMKCEVLQLLRQVDHLSDAMKINVLSSSCEEQRGQELAVDGALIARRAAKVSEKAMALRLWLIRDGELRQVAKSS